MSLSRSGRSMRRGRGFAASPAQQAKVADMTCLVTGHEHCDPAHLIPRGVTTIGQDDPLAVVPLCRQQHALYDTGRLDLLPYLEPGFRAELAFAVQRVGLIATLRTVTNGRYVASVAV